MSAVHSERLGADLHLGKQAATPFRGAINYSTDIRPLLAHAGVLPSVPAMFGHGHDLPQGKWLMLGNGPDSTVAPGFQGCGDCTIVEKAHTAMEAAINAKRPMPAFSGATVVRQYSERTLAANGEAYDPRTGAGDTGLNMQDVNEWAIRHGIADDAGQHYAILDSWAIEPGNMQHIWEAAYLFEKVSIGVVICEAQMRQFDVAAQPTWDYVKGSPEEGGHAVPVVGKLGLISWAEDVYYTPRFIEHQCDEAYVAIDPLIFAKATGQSAEHYAVADLEQFALVLAKRRVMAAR